MYVFRENEKHLLSACDILCLAEGSQNRYPNNNNNTVPSIIISTTFVQYCFLYYGNNDIIFLRFFSENIQTTKNKSWQLVKK